MRCIQFLKKPWIQGARNDIIVIQKHMVKNMQFYENTPLKKM